MRNSPSARAPRLTVSTALLAALALGVAACGSDSSDSSGSSEKSSSGGTIVVGSDLTAPPYASLDGDDPVGFDPEMVEALASRMGQDYVIKDVRFEQLIPSLGAGQIDLIASDLYITAERAAAVDYVPYFSTGNSIMVRSDEGPITGADGLCGKRVAVIKGGAVAGRLRDEASADCEAAGKEPIDVRDFPTDPEATQALVSQQVDAHVTDAAICSAIEDGQDGRVVVTSTDLLFPVPVGLAVRKGNTELKSEIEDALAELKDDGTYDDLLAQYNLRPVDADQVASILGTN